MQSAEAYSTVHLPELQCIASTFEPFFALYCVAISCYSRVNAKPIFHSSSKSFIIVPLGFLCNNFGFALLGIARAEQFEGQAGRVLSHMGPLEDINQPCTV